MAARTKYKPATGKWEGKDILALRKRAMITQSELADYLGYGAFSRVQEFESGRRSLPVAQGKLLNILEAALNKESILLNFGKNCRIRLEPTIIF